MSILSALKTVLHPDTYTHTSTSRPPRSNSWWRPFGISPTIYYCGVLH